MHSSERMLTGLIVFLCIAACLLFLVRKLQVQKRVSIFVHACQESDFDKAGQILETIPAAEDDFEFLFWRGYLHYKGLGDQEKDNELALKFWFQSAAQGHKKAIRALKTVQEGGAFEPYGQRSTKRIISSDYDDGLDAYRLGDYKKAFDLWLPLATKGHREAQSRVGTLYAEGKGVERDMEKAQYWWGLAAGTVDPHQIRDSFRTKTTESSADKKTQTSSVSDKKQETQPTPKESDDEYFDSGMKKTTAIGSMSSIKRQDQLEPSKYVTSSKSEYKPWLNE